MVESTNASQARLWLRLGLSICLVLLGTVIGASRARADDLNLGGTFTQGINMVEFGKQVADGGGSIDISYLNGVQLAWVYCVDLIDQVPVPVDYTDTLVTHNGVILSSGADGAGLTGIGGTPPEGTVNNAGEVAWLLDTYAIGGQGAAQAALQAAIWTVIYGANNVYLNTSAYALNSTVVTDYDAYIAAGAGQTASLANLDWLSPQVKGGTVNQGLVSDPVPDGGVTLMLLGGALVGLETLRRKLRV